MAAAQGYVPVTVGGRDINLKFDFNAIADAEEALGKPLQEILRENEDGAPMLGFNEIRVLLWTGSQGRVKSKRDAGSLLTAENLPEAAGAIGKALVLAFPAAGKDEPAPEGEA